MVMRHGKSFVEEHIQYTFFLNIFSYSHYEAQRADGLYGALVVKDPEEPKSYGYEGEKIVLLSDWYHTESPVLLKDYQYKNASVFDFFEVFHCCSFHEPVGIIIFFF